jgi:hypothetical protein
VGMGSEMGLAGRGDGTRGQVHCPSSGRGDRYLNRLEG